MEKAFMKSSETNNKSNILVLDGDHKNALAIVRHVGKSNSYNIDVASNIKYSITFYSKYVNKKIIISNPKKYESQYISELLEIINNKKYLIVIPVSYISYKVCAKFQEEIRKYSTISITSLDNILLCNNKIETYKLAEKLNIPHPKTYYIKNSNELIGLEIHFPCVVKAPLEIGKNIVRYASNKNELIKYYSEIADIFKDLAVFPVVQEYISGGGFGFFAFYQNGECKRVFMHKRIREYPVKGGASVCAESFYDENLKDYGKRILDYLKWEGVAMVEFKQDKNTGEYKLMEINAKYWGSLDLALFANVNFPQLMIDVSENNEIKYSESFKMIRFQWLLNGELFHFFESPKSFYKIFADLFRSKNDIQFSDIKPNLFQFLMIFIFYYKKWFK